MIASLKQVIKNYKGFFIIYGFFLIGVGILLFIFSKEESFFFVNSIHTQVGDVFFKGLTHLGDGVLFALITVVFGLYRYRLALLGLIIFLSSSLIAQVLKLTIFDNVKRPVGHFGGDVDIHFVEGVTRHVNNSFPSGHTTTAFALAMFLVLAFEMRKGSFLMALLAILVGYSRVYLAVHFPIDVYFGSLIGVISAVLIYIWLDEPFKSRFANNGLMKK